MFDFRVSKYRERSAQISLSLPSIYLLNEFPPDYKPFFFFFFFYFSHIFSRSIEALENQISRLSLFSMRDAYTLVDTV